MTGLWPALAATVLATALTYGCCIRPMPRHGGCAPAPRRRTERSKADPAAAPGRGPGTIEP